MGKSINPMCGSLQTGGAAVLSPASTPIVLMSLQSAIPWRIALQQGPPPLCQPGPSVGALEGPLPV